MNRLFKMLLLISLLLMLPACGSRRELNEMGIVIANGIDGTEGNYKLTTQVIIPSALYNGTGSSGGSGSELGVFVFHSSGKTIREAINRNTLENPRNLYLSHNNVLVIGKETANEGLNELIDRFTRNFESRETVKVLVAANTAQEVLEMLMPPEKLPGKAMSDTLDKQHRWTSIYKPINMYELALKFTSESAAAGVPEIRLEGTDGVVLKSSDAYKQTSPPGSLVISGLSLFQNGRRVGSLNEKESRGVSWLMNQVKEQTISFGDKEDEGDSKRSLSACQILSAKVKVTPVKVEDGYMLKVRAKVKGELSESTSLEDIDTVKGMRHMEEQVEQEITDIMMQGWKALRKRKVDVLGIGDKLYRQNPKVWRTLKPEWAEQFSKMKIDISVKASIKRPGLVQQSFRKVEEQVQKTE